MRILVIGPVYPDSFADNLVTALADVGHETTSVAPFPDAMIQCGRLTSRLEHEVLAVPRLARRLQRHVLDAAEQRRPDLVLNVDYRLSFALVPDLRAVARAPVAFWFPDSPGNLGRETHVLAGYDALFLKDRAVVERYRRLLGLDAHFLPEACNPRWHRPIGDPVGPWDRPAALLAGNMYATRFGLVRALVEQGVDVVVEGPPWARWLPQEDAVRRCYSGRYLAREGKALAFRAAPIVLNSLASHEADGLNCRLFEAAACGAIVLSEWRPRLPDFFDLAREVREYRDFSGLVAAIHQLCRLGVDERRDIGDAASARAHAHHTYSHRLEQISSVLGRG